MSNTMLGALFVLVGLVDVVLAHVMRDRMPPVGVTLLRVGGVAFAALGLLIAYGVVNLI